MTSLQYHPYGEFIVSGSIDCSMKVWDVRNKSCIQTYTGHNKAITCVRFSPDGKWVASSSKDGQLLFWDLIAGKLVNTVKLNPNYISSFEFNPTEFSLAAITSARTVKLWDLDTMECINSTPPESGPVRCIAYSNLGSLLFSSVKDTLRIWDMEPVLKMKDSLEINWDKITDMKISNNSQMIAGSCNSNFVSIYEIDLEDYLNSNTSADNKSILQSPPTSSKPKSSSNSNNNNNNNNNNTPKQLNKVRSAKLNEDYDNIPSNDYKLPPEEYKSPSISSKQKYYNDNDDSKDNDDDNNNNSNNSKPEVVWEDSDVSGNEMATSMGESFWKRFNENAKKNNNNNNVMDLKELGDHLPPPSYDNFGPSVDKHIKPIQNQSNIHKYNQPLIHKEDNKSDNNNNNNPLEIIGSRHSRERVDNNKYNDNSSDSKNVNNTQNEYKKCDDFLNIMLAKSPPLLSILSQRLASLRILKQLWTKGDILDAIDHLTIHSDSLTHNPHNLILLADFFEAVDLKNNGLTLDYCDKLLSILDEMINNSESYNSSHVIFAVFKSITSLSESFGELIRQTRSVIIAGGVDLSREARLIKCNSCYSIFIKFKNRLESVKHQFRKNSKIIDILDKFQKQISIYYCN